MEAQNFTSLKVILTDDDADDRYLFKIALKKIGADIHLTPLEGGKALLQHLTEITTEAVDVIFLDINMPCINGKECLTEIRSNEKFQDTPVIMLSTSSSEEDIEDTFAGGANLYIIKPNSFDEEIQVLKSVFSISVPELLLNRDRENYVFNMATALVKR